MPDLPNPFEPFDLAGQPAIVAAVSGGSDSTALLILLKQHLDRIGRGDRLVAVTVDHALRPGSAEEATAVARLCDHLGVRHRTAVWTGEKPRTGLPAAARAARYALLAQEARQLGSLVVVTGHTADDQAETVAMRQARRGDRGLAGMAPATLFQGRLWILRPLLGLSRHQLRETLRAQDVGWFDDPTNANPRHERARLRATLTRQEAADLLVEATRAAERRTAEGLDAAALLTASACLAAPGLVRLSPDFRDSASRVTATYAMRMLLSCLGGVTHLPDDARTSAMVEAMGKPGLRATLSRCMIEARKDGVYLRREQRSLPASQPATPGEIWDGRFTLDGQPGSNPPVVAPSAESGLDADAGDTIAAAVPARLVQAAGRTLPRLFDADGESVSTSRWALRPVLAPWRDFLPAFDLAPARALAGLLGAEPFPDPPLRHHNVRPA